MRLSRLLSVLLFCVGSAAVSCLPAQAQHQHASGAGTHFLPGGIRTEFEFNDTHVQCKVAHAVLPDGTVLQMFMDSTSIDSVTIDSAAKTVTITGTMVSIVNLRFPDGSKAHLVETVPFLMYAEDNGTTGAGKDYFALTVDYTDTPGLDQFDLFGSPAKFAGILVSGDIVVR